MWFKIISARDGAFALCAIQARCRHEQQCTRFHLQHDRSGARAAASEPRLTFIARADKAAFDPACGHADVPSRFAFAATSH